jgi:hypothetical protein
MKRSIATALLALALALAACGEDEENGEEGTAEAEPASEAVMTDVSVLQAGVADLARDYAAGDSDKAAATLEDLVLERLEAVEGELEAIDPELAEQLDAGIGEQLSAAVDSGAPAEEVIALVRTIGFELRQAQAVLRGGAPIAEEEEGEEAESESESEGGADPDY